MKKILLVLTIGFTTNITIAQGVQDIIEDCRDKMMVGLKAGLNYSNIYAIKGANYQANSIVGFAGGGLIDIPMTTQFGLHAELLYSQKGYKAIGDIPGNKYSFTRRSQFIDAPILFAWMPGEHLSLLAGIQYSYLISQKNVSMSGPSDIERQQAFIDNNDTRKNVVCAVGGFDFNYNKFVVGIRGGWDLVNNTGSGTSSTPQYKNTWYQVTLGYRFNVKNVCGNNDEGDY